MKNLALILIATGALALQGCSSGGPTPIPGIPQSSSSNPQQNPDSSSASSLSTDSSQSAGVSSSDISSDGSTSSGGSSDGGNSSVPGSSTGNSSEPASSSDSTSSGGVIPGSSSSDAQPSSSSSVGNTSSSEAGNSSSDSTSSAQDSTSSAQDSSSSDTSSDSSSSDQTSSDVSSSSSSISQEKIDAGRTSFATSCNFCHNDNSDGTFTGAGIGVSFDVNNFTYPEGSSGNIYVFDEGAYSADSVDDLAEFVGGVMASGSCDTACAEDIAAYLWSLRTPPVASSSSAPTSSSSDGATSSVPASSSSDGTTSSDPASSSSDGTTSSDPASSSSDGTTSSDPASSSSDGTTSSDPASSSSDGTTSSDPASSSSDGTTSSDPVSSSSDGTTSSVATSSSEDASSSSSSEPTVDLTAEKAYVEAVQRISYGIDVEGFKGGSFESIGEMLTGASKDAYSGFFADYESAGVMDKADPVISALTSVLTEVAFKFLNQWVADGALPASDTIVVPDGVVVEELFNDATFDSGAVYRLTFDSATDVLDENGNPVGDLDGVDVKVSVDITAYALGGTVNPIRLNLKDLKVNFTQLWASDDNVTVSAAAPTSADSHLFGSVLSVQAAYEGELDDPDFGLTSLTSLALTMGNMGLDIPLSISEAASGYTMDAAIAGSFQGRATANPVTEGNTTTIPLEFTSPTLTADMDAEISLSNGSESVNGYISDLVVADNTGGNFSLDLKMVDCDGCEDEGFDFELNETSSAFLDMSAALSVNAALEGVSDVSLSLLGQRVSDELNSISDITVSYEGMTYDAISMEVGNEGQLSSLTANGTDAVISIGTSGGERSGTVVAGGGDQVGTISERDDGNLLVTYTDSDTFVWLLRGGSAVVDSGNSSSAGNSSSQGNSSSTPASSSSPNSSAPSTSSSSGNSSSAPPVTGVNVDLPTYAEQVSGIVNAVNPLAPQKTIYDLGGFLDDATKTEYYRVAEDFSYSDIANGQAGYVATGISLVLTEIAVKFLNQYVADGALPANPDITVADGQVIEELFNEETFEDGNVYRFTFNDVVNACGGATGTDIDGSCLVDVNTSVDITAYALGGTVKPISLNLKSLAVNFNTLTGENAYVRAEASPSTTASAHVTGDVLSVRAEYEGELDDEGFGLGSITSIALTAGNIGFDIPVTVSEKKTTPFVAEATIAGNFQLRTTADPVQEREQIEGVWYDVNVFPLGFSAPYLTAAADVALSVTKGGESIDVGINGLSISDATSGDIGVDVKLYTGPDGAQSFAAELTGESAESYINANGALAVSADLNNADPVALWAGLSRTSDSVASVTDLTTEFGEYALEGIDMDYDLGGYLVGLNAESKEGYRIDVVTDGSGARSGGVYDQNGNKVADIVEVNGLLYIVMPDGSQLPL